ncbi:MAG: hypothetical protein PVF85_02000 [Anaerolineales bacterium]
MTDASSVFQRLGTMGWLTLASSPPRLDQAGAQLSERLLEVTDLSRPPFVLTPEPQLQDELERFVEDLQILLGVEIQILNPVDLDDVDLQNLWLNAGIMIMADGTKSFWLDVINERLFRSRPLEILAEGALLFALGESASLMGAWALNQERHEIETALGWIQGSIILPTNENPASIAAVRNHLEEREGVFALGLPDGALLALGPDEQIEVWTEVAPVLLLGKGWQ